MELVELHVHQRHAATIGDRNAVAGAGQRVRGDLEDAAEAAGGDQHRLGVEDVDLAGFELAGRRTPQHAPSSVKSISSKIVLVEEVDVVLDALLVERLDDHVAGAVGGVAGAADRRSRRNCGCGRRTGADRSCLRACD